ncbi:MAG: WD40 repeat domain-containing protein [Planctomycetota bacterium]|jgi:WD40 repeat protein
MSLPVWTRLALILLVTLGLAACKTYKYEPDYRFEIDGDPMAVVVGPDGSTLATATFDGGIMIFDLARGTKVREIPAHGYGFRHIAFSADGSHLYSVEDAGYHRTWDLKTGKESRPYLQLKSHRMDRIALDGARGRVAVAQRDGVLLKNLSDGQVRARLQGIPPGGSPASMAFSPDGRLLAVGGFTVDVWDLPSRTRVATLQPSEDDTAHAMSFSPDGSQLATATWTIDLWNVSTWKRTRSLRGHSRFIHSLAYHPEGRTLASAGSDGSVRLWDLSQGTDRVLCKTGWIIDSVVFTPRGDHLFAATAKGRVDGWKIPLR